MSYVLLAQNNNKKQMFGGVVSLVAISKVLTGGSMGKGTMVPRDFDVDLIIFSRCEHNKNYYHTLI